MRRAVNIALHFDFMQLSQPSLSQQLASAASQLNQIAVLLTSNASILSPLLDRSEVEKVIMAEVCREWQITLSQLTSPQRFDFIWKARCAAYLLLSEHDITCKRSAHLFGCKDHATAINGIKRAKARSETEPKFRQKIEATRQRISEAVTKIVTQ